MVSPLLLTLLVPPAGWVLASVLGLAVNYMRARKIGIPVIVMPFSPTNPAWMFAARIIMPVFRRLPVGPGYFTRFGFTGWEHVDRYRAHVEFGDAFVIVTPGFNWVYLCDADAINDVVQRERRHEFFRPLELMAMLDVFGPNISTVDGPDWQRHRKCTSSSFNERTNKRVWSEALRLAGEMLGFWTSEAATGIRSTAEDARTMTLGVLLGGGFGKSVPFRSSTSAIPDGPLNYRDSLALILQNVVLILAVGPKLLTRVSIPRSWARIGEATTTFKGYMAEMLNEEKRRITAGEPGADNIMTSLIRASTDEKQKGLSEDEVFGNMFVFNFAGHDSTAHMMTFSLLLLAAHPEVQDWISEEVNHVFPNGDTSTWSYDNFPRLNRCLSVILETLRLYNPLLSVVKTTQDLPTSLRVGGKNLVFPPTTRVMLNLPALHTHPRYWGDDSLTWRPQRWVKITPGEGPLIDSEEVITKPKETFLPWSEGSRGCPGKKFVQVEHVASMAALFRSHRVVPVPQNKEDQKDAELRIQRIVDDSAMVLLLQVLHPEKAVLQWKSVDSAINY